MMINAHAIKFMRMCISDSLSFGRSDGRWSAFSIELGWYPVCCLIQCVKWCQCLRYIKITHTHTRARACCWLKCYAHTHAHAKKAKKPIEWILSIYRIHQIDRIQVYSYCSAKKSIPKSLNRRFRTNKPQIKLHLIFRFLLIGGFVFLSPYAPERVRTHIPFAFWHIFIIAVGISFFLLLPILLVISLSLSLFWYLVILADFVSVCVLLFRQYFISLSMWLYLYSHFHFSSIFNSAAQSAGAAAAATATATVVLFVPI